MYIIYLFCGLVLVNNLGYCLHEKPKINETSFERTKNEIEFELPKNSEIASDDDYSVNATILNYNITGIDELLKIFDVSKLAKRLPVFAPMVNRTCRNDMIGYIKGLHERRIWAVKMDDATGRYGSAFLWGDGYWTGSEALCSNAQEPITDGEETPPFTISFYMVKLLFNKSVVSQDQDRTIHLGMCLPFSCSMQDVHAIVSSGATNAKFTVESVRSPDHQYFNIWKDNTFCILCAACSVVTLLLACGSGYDLMLRKRSRTVIAASASGPASISTKYNSLCDPAQVTLEITSTKEAQAKRRAYCENNNNMDEDLNPPEIQIVEEKLEKRNIFSELLLAFSVPANMASICDRSVGSDTLPTVHGLRSISMAWVILGHTCIVAFKYADNQEYRKLIEREILFKTITNATYSVDTFFFISGLLVSFLYFRTNAKGKLDKLIKGKNCFGAGVFQFLGLLGYRFARLTAPYLFVLGVVEVTMKWFYYNSLFEPPTFDHINCEKYSWRNILYINTLFPVEDMCMLWSWYLADDTQFYVIGSIILIIATSHFRTAFSGLVILMMSSWVTTAFIAYESSHIPNSNDPLSQFDKIYDKPWTRLGPYLIGMSVGWILFKTNCKIYMSKTAVVIGWILAAAGLLFLVYGLHNVTLTAIPSAAYSSLCHTIWAICLGWIIIACSTGYGGPINSLLSWTALYPFSRVTYCAYLIHPIIIRLLPMYSDAPLHLGKCAVVILYLGQAVSSYVLSFIVSVAFEAPVVSMLKILAPNRRKKC